MKFEDLQNLKQSCYIVVKKLAIETPAGPYEDVVEIHPVTPHMIKNMAEKDPKLVAFELRPLSVKAETVITNMEGDKL